MHELSIAMSLVEMAEEEAIRHRAGKVQKVHVGVGPLAGVAKEALLFSFSLACEGTLLEGSQLVIKDAEGRELDLIALEVE